MGESNEPVFGEPEGQPGGEEQAQREQAPAEITPELLFRQMQEMREALAESRKAWSEREKELEIENARLKGMVEAGGRGQGASDPVYETDREYQFAAKLLEQQAAQVEKGSPEFLQLKQQYDALQTDYSRFQGTKQRKAEEGTKRRIDRSAFLASRRIDPASETARLVERLHDSGIPLERIEATVLAPNMELARMRAETGAKGRTTAELGNATAIEPGITRTNVPPPVTGQKAKTADQAAADDLVNRMAAQYSGQESILFGQE